MRAVVQRVSRAMVTAEGELTGEIGKGLLVFLGVTHRDGQKDVDYLVDKVVNLRIFGDQTGKMNLSLEDIHGEMLVVSQFTLYGDTRRGKRPSFIDAANVDDATRWYECFVANAKEKIGKIATGRFGAMMKVELVNDGPVTIILDSEKTI
ncbi:MAG: D-aminoacyl-tRNA deacylase [Pyrinomonadaceae bacterium]